MQIDITYPALDAASTFKWDAPPIDAWLDSAREIRGDDGESWGYRLRGRVNPPASDVALTIDIYTNQWWPQATGVKPDAGGNWQARIFLHDQLPACSVRVRVLDGGGNQLAQRVFEVN